MKPTQQKLHCADLFSGAGGFSQAALNCGVQISFAVEFDKHAAKTYRDNIITQSPTAELFEGDIRNLDFLDIAARMLGANKSCDIVLGGPPCQGYSSHRINNAGVNDERNDLIHSYFECVKALKPLVFLMENVPGMLWPRHKEYVSEFYREGVQSGYELFDPVILDARDFGVPQRRKRVFILGVRNDVDHSSLEWPPRPTHSNPRENKKIELPPWRSCQSVFRAAPTGDPNDRHMKHGAELIAAFKQTPANGGSRRDSGRTLPCHLSHNGHKDVYGRIDSTLPAPTMTTACINPSKGRFVHPTKHHGITVREAARIQTFPDSFVFSGGLMAAGKQVGNAVPVLLGESLLSSITSFLKNAKKEKHRRPARSLEVQ